MEKGKVVVIDDSPIVRKLAELALEEEGYKVYTASDGEEGLKVAEDISPALILVDFIMPRMSGYEFCKSARESSRLKDVPIILITGKGEDVGKKFIEKFGIADYFIKPFKSETLTEKVNAMILTSRDHHDMTSAVDHVVDGYDVDSAFPPAADGDSQFLTDTMNYQTDTSLMDRDVSLVIDRREGPSSDLSVTGDTDLPFLFDRQEFSLADASADPEESSAAEDSLSFDGQIEAELPDQSFITGDTDLPFLFDRQEFSLADASAGPEESSAAEDSLSFDGQIEAELPEQPSLAEKSDPPFLFKRENFSLHDIASGDEEILSSAVSSSEENLSFVGEDEASPSPEQRDEYAISDVQDPDSQPIWESENREITPGHVSPAGDLQVDNLVDVPVQSAAEEAQAVHGPSDGQSPAALQQPDDLEKMMDRVVSRYFAEDLPFLIQKSVHDTLKHTGMARSAALTLSGELSAVHLLDVIQIITANRLTGKLSVFSPFLSSEVYFDGGALICATTSRHERHFLSLGQSRESRHRRSESMEVSPGGNMTSETRRSGDSGDASDERMITLLRERIVDTFCSLLELRQGTFFIETLILPDSLLMVPLRLNVLPILVEAAHKACSAEGAKGIQDSNAGVFTAYRDPGSWGLSEEELDVLSGINGGTKIGDLMMNGEMVNGSIGDILDVLMKVGLVRAS
ncbi:MAG TPA: response regulator [Dissulfurispiraceae bacterium]|nr:response regulator [Dissulfurispiraceae bacterium]